ncbi:hypothetical protein Belba_2987 [Belliella baltica DSM 15883]|uniref:Uncharacterized protein n=1 Tax=Belliella baltica (strain DSM 15883 / CIP 108006 / LMG 21964 / BA134) TaxID=866536 RepID=I3Z8E0_BELBD|nr:hypothetical protein [Belliella baltica]AFL85508.1 hypothetical protein Belba_2987 [Belliella baltica DSM 15883]
MKFTNLIIGLFLTKTLFSCSKDDSFPDYEQLKSYDLIEIKWKLEATNSQNIVEKKIPEFYFENDSDKPMSVVIKPLENIEGSSIFEFDDLQTFEKLNFSKTQVVIPKELSLLSEQYVNLSSGVKAPLTNEESFFPFSRSFKDSITLNKNNSLTANYTLYLKENKANFLAIFKENSTGEILELTGNWTGMFFEKLSEKTVINEIE